jgi:flagellar hook-basal body complex protein FliE
MTINAVQAPNFASQVKLLEARIDAFSNNAAATGKIGEGGTAERVSFSELISTSVGKVNETLISSRDLGEAFLRQEPGADLVKTMAASSKAQVSFRAMVEVRNQLIQAYKDVSNMPI